MKKDIPSLANVVVVEMFHFMIIIVICNLDISVFYVFLQAIIVLRLICIKTD